MSGEPPPETDATTSDATCEMCEEDYAVAAFACSQCEQRACQACARTHARIKATRSHTLTQLDTPPGLKATEATPPPWAAENCSVHKDEKLRFYCSHCRLAVCRDCKLTSHEGHASVDVGEKRRSAVTLLEQVTPLLKDGLDPKLEEMLLEAKGHGKHVVQRKKQLAATLRQRAETIKAEVDACLSRAEKELLMEAGDAELAADGAVAQMTDMLRSLRDLTQRAETAVNQGGGGDALLVALPKQMGEMVGAKQAPRSISGGFDFGLGSNLGPSPDPGKLDVFTNRGWQLDLRLVDSLVNNSTTAANTGFGNPGVFSGGFIFRSNGPAAPASAFAPGPATSPSPSQSDFSLPETLKAELGRCLGSVKKVPVTALQDPRRAPQPFRQNFNATPPLHDPGVAREVKAAEFDSLLTKLQGMLREWV